jgi:anti-sigma regulatory factor (Ser/Thr protein kinase)
VLFHKGGGVLAIEVVDGGGGFDPASVPDAIVVPDRRRTGRIRGFGLFLIKRLSDGLDTVAGAHGHSLRMRFTLPKPVPSSSEGR